MAIIRRLRSEAAFTAWDGRKRQESESSSGGGAFAAYEKAYPELAAEFARRMSGGFAGRYGNPAQIY